VTRKQVFCNYWYIAWQGAILRQAIPSEQRGLGTRGAWRQGRFRQAIDAKSDCAEALGA